MKRFTLNATPSPHLGAVCAALAYFIYTITDSIVKSMGHRYPVTEISFFTGTITSLVLVSYGISRHSLVSLKTGNMKFHILRGTIGMVQSMLGFYAYRNMPLTNAYSIYFSAPLFVTALSVVILGETVSRKRWIATAAGFIGIIIMLRPNSNLSLASLGVLGAAILYSINITIMRFTTRTDPSIVVTLYPALTTLAILAIILPFNFTLPDTHDLLWLFLGGFLGATAAILLVIGYRLATASLAAPFQYTQILWGTVIGWLLWRDLPDFWMMVGGSIVIAAGLYSVYVQTYEGRSSTVTTDPAAAPIAETLDTPEFKDVTV